MEKPTIYQPHMGKYVRVITHNGSPIGVLKEVTLDRAVLNPSLIIIGDNYYEEVSLRNADTIVNYLAILGMQELNEKNIEQIRRNTEENHKVKRKTLERVLADCEKQSDNK